MLSTFGFYSKIGVRMGGWARRNRLQLPDLTLFTMNFYFPIFYSIISLFSISSGRFSLMILFFGIRVTELRIASDLLFILSYSRFLILALRQDCFFSCWSSCCIGSLSNIYFSICSKVCSFSAKAFLLF